MITISRYIIKNDNQHVDLSVLLPFDGIDNISITQERGDRDKKVYVIKFLCKSGDGERSVALRVTEIPISFPIVIDTTSKIEFVEDTETEQESN